MTKISIITVVFNPIQNGRKEMLLQAIDSVFGQDYQNKEHIIIDGSSTDGTIELLNELKSQGKITHFISEPDTGIYDAMNKGANLASGDYIAFLNSDDYYVDMQALTKIANSIQKFDYCYAPVTLLQEGTDVILGQAQPIPRRFLTKIPFGHQSFFMRKNLFQAIGGFDIGFKLLSDYDLILRSLLQGAKGIGLKKAFVCYRMGGASEDTHKGKAEKIKIWTKNYGIADYAPYINKKVLPIKILIKIFNQFPKARKNVLYEIYRTLRKGKI
jgi:glycosyltransferase involved in cell wall biosynthesis